MDPLPLAFMLRGDAVGTLLICSCDASLSISSSWAGVFCDVVDSSTSEVSGPGTVGFVRRDSARNTVRFVPRFGAVAEYVTMMASLWLWLVAALPYQSASLAASTVGHRKGRLVVI